MILENMFYHSVYFKWHVFLLELCFKYIVIMVQCYLRNLSLDLTAIIIIGYNSGGNVRSPIADVLNQDAANFI